MFYVLKYVCVSVDGGEIMTVNLNTSNLKFRADNNTCTCEHRICPQCGKPIADSCDIHSDLHKEKNTKKDFFTNMKDKFIGIRKGFVDFGYITLGTVKGGLYGAAAGLATAGIVAVRNVVKKSPKTLGVGGKVLAGTVGLAVLIGNVVKSKLDANSVKADLDHRWRSGHNG